MLGPAEFLKLITGTGNPAMMFMMGKVKARGDLGLAGGLANWFEAPKG
jgi:putative sterol carrier protein